jgi:hypothetical protein
MSRRMSFRTNGPSTWTLTLRPSRSQTPLCPQAITDVPETRPPKQPEATHGQADADVKAAPGDHRSQHISDLIEDLEPRVDRLQASAPPPIE